MTAIAPSYYPPVFLDWRENPASGRRVEVRRSRSRATRPKGATSTRRLGAGHWNAEEDGTEQHRLSDRMSLPDQRLATGWSRRLFRGARGAMLSESSYGRIRRQAREKAPTSAQVRSPLVARPYDLRHSGVTLQLNAGVPAPEVARRAGHVVAVLLRVYAGCIEGHEQLWNSRIDDALRDEDTG